MCSRKPPCTPSLYAQPRRRYSGAIERTVCVQLTDSRAIRMRGCMRASVSPKPNHPFRSDARCVALRWPNRGAPYSLPRQGRPSVCLKGVHEKRRMGLRTVLRPQCQHCKNVRNGAPVCTGRWHCSTAPSVSTPGVSEASTCSTKFSEWSSPVNAMTFVIKNASCGEPMATLS